jgi:hypothetical protein
MSTNDVLITPGSGEVKWVDSGGAEFVRIIGDGSLTNTITFVGDDNTSNGVIFQDHATDVFYPATSGLNLGITANRWNFFGTGGDFSGSLTVATNITLSGASSTLALSGTSSALNMSGSSGLFTLSNGASILLTGTTSSITLSGLSSVLTLAGVTGTNLAPLMFTTGSAPGTSVAGQMWWTGSANLQFAKTNGTASTFVFLDTDISTFTTGTLGVGHGGTGTATTFTTGSVVFAGTSGIYTQDNANFFFDGTNHTLGVGTTRTGAISGTNPAFRIKGSGATSATSSFEVQDSAAASLFFVRNDGLINFGSSGSFTNSTGRLALTTTGSGAGVVIGTSSIYEQSVNYGGTTLTAIRHSVGLDTDVFICARAMYDENSTTPGAYMGRNTSDNTPRFGFFNGTAAQNWQIDNSAGTFRWYLPGVVHMALTTTAFDLINNKQMQGIGNILYNGGITQSGTNGNTFTAPTTFSITGNSAIVVSGAPQASATVALVRLGGAISGGNASGTYFGINAASSYAGDVVDIQLNGVISTTVDRYGAWHHGPGSQLDVPAWGTTGVYSDAKAATFRDSSTATSGTATNAVFTSFAQPTLTATNATVTTTNAATVYIANAPAASTNQTITNAYALWIANGKVRIDGTLLLNAFTSGSVLFAGTSGLMSQDNSNFFFDGTNHTLGVGTTRTGAISGTNPSLRVKGTGTTSSTSSFEVQDSGATTLFFVRDDGLIKLGSKGTYTESTGQVALTATGSGGGLVIGGDANFYRSAAATLKTDNSLIVATNLSVLNAGVFSLYKSGSANFSSFVAGAQSADLRYTLPISQPTTNQILSASAISGAGPYDITLAWVTNSASISIGSSVASGTIGSVLFVGGSNDLQQDNANFFWDNTNHTHGIGTTRTGAISSTNPGTRLKGTGTSSSTSSLEVQDSGASTLFFVRDDGRIGIGSNAPAARLHIAGNISQAAWGFIGVGVQVVAATYTDSSTGVSGTATNAAFHTFAQPTLAATSATVTTTNATTVYIANAPTAGTNQTITNAFALWVGAGLVRFDAGLRVTGAITGTTSLTLGASGGTTGSLLLSGTTSGTVTITPQAAAGTYNFNLPTTAGTTGQVLTSAAGGGTPMTWTDPGSLFPWTNVSGTSQTAAAGNGYIANNAGLVTITLPTPAVGTVIKIVGLGAGGWKAQCASSHTIRLGTTVSAATGFAASTAASDSIEILGVSTTQWQVISSIGTIDVT